MDRIRNRFWRYLNKRSRKKNKEISLKYPHHYYCSIIQSPKTEYPKKKKKLIIKEKGILHVEMRLQRLGSVWYMCLKTTNCCLKTFMEIHVDEKVH